MFDLFPSSTKAEGECSRKHACIKVLEGDRVCWKPHREPDHTD